MLIMAVAAAACGDSETASPPGEVLTVGQVAEPQSLDPHTVTSLNDFRILVNLYEGLVQFRDGTLEIEPALATSWTISDDGLIYTFELRDSVEFHDGSPFTAEAVQFNVERMLIDHHPAHDTGPFPLAFMLDAIERVEVIDSLTVRFMLSQAYAPLLSNLAYPIGLMVSPAAVEQYGSDFGRNPSGTGPFRFREWQSRRRVVLDRNVGYWDDAPRLQSVVFQPITDPVTRVTELQAGGVDLIVEVPPDQIASLRGSPDFTVHEASGPHVWFLILNTREGPFTDVRVRRAVNYAVDKRALVDNLLQGTATIAAGPVPAAFGWAHNDGVDPYPFDTTRAKQLLREAGYDDGIDVTFLATQGGSGMLAPVQMATAIQADLARVGIRAEIETYEWNTFLSRVNGGLEGLADMAEMAWMTNDPHTLPALALRRDAWPSEGGFNSGYYENPTVDSLLTIARRTPDNEQRGAIYERIQEIVHDDAPWLFVASWRQHAVTSNGVAGFDLQPSFFLRLDDTYVQ